MDLKNLKEEDLAKLVNEGQHTKTAFDPQASIHQSELNRLVQQLHDLRRALKPFAQFARALPPVILGTPRITDSGPAFTTGSTTEPLKPMAVITFGDLRHANALLNRLEEQDEKRFITNIENKMTAGAMQCLARDCLRNVNGAEPHHTAGFCSIECSVHAAAGGRKLSL